MKAAWIKPEVELPDSGAIVLIRLRSGDKRVWVGYRIGETWYFDTSMKVPASMRVTGWMHLPDPEDAQ